MLYIFGTKSFFLKIKAYKSVWCMHCQKPVLAKKTRRFVMWHLFYIPFLPLGFRTEWNCTECNKDPHANWSIYDAFGMLFLAVMFGSIFISEKNYSSLHLSTSWLLGLRILFAICVLYSVWLIFDLLKPVKSKHPVDPLNNVACLVCDNGLDASADAVCSSCGVIREGL